MDCKYKVFVSIGNRRQVILNQYFKHVTRFRRISVLDIKQVFWMNFMWFLRLFHIPSYENSLSCWYSFGTSPKQMVGWYVSYQMPLLNVFSLGYTLLVHHICVHSHQITLELVFYIAKEFCLGFLFLPHHKLCFEGYFTVIGTFSVVPIISIATQYNMTDFHLRTQDHYYFLTHTQTSWSVHIVTFEVHKVVAHVPGILSSFMCVWSICIFLHI